eukprot:gb/GECG01005181.1/.p1 GENE.gb/GECG01005181.1/~~gb/GECG01005181.1/.p1  ORF type:complete len:123 (+),score=10.64 gb/GECG01005181.1/:1-369(+)
MVFFQEMKLVLAVRTDLKMKPGKIASQCAHAAVTSYKHGIKKMDSKVMRAWENQGQPKIVIKVPNVEEFATIRQQCHLHSVPVITIRDAGRTQINSGDETVIAVGPANSDTINKITGKYPLL